MSSSQLQVNREYRGLVKAALSSDTLVIRGKLSGDAQVPEEVVLRLDGLQGPRIGTVNKEDEPFAFEARQFVIDVAVGKVVDFRLTSDSPRFGIVSLPQGEYSTQDLSTHILRNGWAKLRQNNPHAALNVIQEHSKQKQRGVWGARQPLTVSHASPADLQSFVDAHARKSFPATVEHVRDGHTLRIRLGLSPNSHQYLTLALAGLSSPKPGREDIAEPAQQFGPLSKLYTELKCLQRNVRVSLLGTNPSATIVLGCVTLDDGSPLAESVLANGFARFADWHAPTLAAHGPSLLPSLKVAEKFAREKRLNLWQSYQEPALMNKSAADIAANGHITHPRQSNVVVTRVWSGDQISVCPIDKHGRDGAEKRVQIASVRQPRSSDAKLAYWASEARELLRKKLIGKRVVYQHDYTRPKEENFEEREAATIRVGPSHQSIGLLLVERGLASVVRHRRDDDRSHEYDALLVAEQTAAAGGKGLHSNKHIPLPRIPDASESASKAQSFLPQWKRSGRITGVAEYVASGSRFKIYIPKDNQKLTLVLAGLKAPRTARNPSEKNEEGAVEALAYATRNVMQRDVEVSIESTDKAGGFIGTLYVNNENFGVGLVRRGLASVHEYSAEGLSFADELFEAEQQARDSRLGVWTNYDPVAQQAAAEAEAETEARQMTTEDEASDGNLIDILISDVRASPHFSFSVQLVGSEDSQKFERLMNAFSAHYNTLTSNEPFSPSNGILVAARFSQDGQWYRARVRRCSHVLKTAEVVFIDYGNNETVSYGEIRPLDNKFKTMPPQAIPAKLSFVNLLPIDHEYGQESLDRFKELCQGRNLVAKVDAKDANGTLHLRLLDPSDPDSAISAEYCINADLVADGLALIDKKTRYAGKYPEMQFTLQDALQAAKNNRAGAFEYGDITED
ncbi:nuclease domain-containing protein 1 [Wallemia ichthyophaga EXF-994]|uniref:Nuclease domain-containing protein 1 n=1 Tax=Wallemia ichthyophaga (strain EXF-994 / CBS 113033) TaxID=1299270 RepID=R9AJ04_WALI9|nr:nuclease domain-containing protein 1 [Wallemia ichthyophaga EXF-994]EOR02095.1 nuclease domain-containing protein 1 [Wallemia ichthyophaga EXF-994]